MVYCWQRGKEVSSEECNKCTRDCSLATGDFDEEEV